MGKKMETTKVALGDLRTHPALQPRDMSLVKLRDQPRLEAQSEALVGHMAAHLKASAKAQLTPMHVADVGGVFYVVDGHHRLKAYKRVGRKVAPCVVVRMTMKQASHASKLANLEHTKLPLHIEQLRDACWQHLASITLRGTCGLPAGTSQRSIVGLFNVPLGTVQRMLEKLPEVARKEWSEDQLDAITRWPRWRFTRGTVRNDMYQQMTHDARLEWRAEKYVKALVKLLDRTPDEVRARGHSLMREQAGSDDETALAADVETACWAATDRGEDAY